MTQVQIFEGSWDELMAHAAELQRYRQFRVMIEPESQDARTKPQANEKGLAAMQEIAERQKQRPFTENTDIVELVREARKGAMYGNEPSE